MAQEEQAILDLRPKRFGYMLRLTPLSAASIIALPGIGLHGVESIPWITIFPEFTKSPTIHAWSEDNQSQRVVGGMHDLLERRLRPGRAALQSSLLQTMSPTDGRR
jgi:hypothetical protein